MENQTPFLVETHLKSQSIDISNERFKDSYFARSAMVNLSNLEKDLIRLNSLNIPEEYRLQYESIKFLLFELIDKSRNRICDLINNKIE